MIFYVKNIFLLVFCENIYQLMFTINLLCLYSIIGEGIYYNNNIFIFISFKFIQYSCVVLYNFFYVYLMFLIASCSPSGSSKFMLIKIGLFSLNLTSS